MIHHVFRHLWGGRLFGHVLRGLGSAILAGFGWKLGSDAYKSIKKEAQKPAEPEKRESPDTRHA